MIRIVLGLVKYSHDEGSGIMWVTAQASILG